MTEQVISYLEREGDHPFFVHLSYLRPHPPYRNPPGYHDLYDLDDVPPFDARPTREEEQAVHPLMQALAQLPGVRASSDERERRQLRATYHGMQAEVDAQLGRLLDWLRTSGLLDDTLVVVTSDHGELGGDHWCIGKGGWFDASFRVPLIVHDPRPTADPGRGRVVGVPTEAVDVMPTILEWIGAEVPLQVDGWSLRWAMEGRGVPEHWRDAAHMEWDFRNPARRLAEEHWGLPSAHCVLTVLRSEELKYVQFAADAAVLPPLLFDLGEDPAELRDVARESGRGDDCYRAASELLRWRMREDDRELANSMLTFNRGIVRVRDAWR